MSKRCKEECFDCKYCEDKQCTHPYCLHCEHSELWTPKRFSSKLIVDDLIDIED